MRIFLLITFCLLMKIECQAGVPGEKKIPDGYPVANFALTVNASATGDLYGDIMQNPGKLGDWLSGRGNILFGVEKDGRNHLLSGFGKKTVQRRFPFVKNTYSASPSINSTLVVETFCPLGINDPETSSLPLLMLEVTCTNSTSADETFTLTAHPDEVLTENCRKGLCRIDADVETRWVDGNWQIPVSLKAGEKKQLRILLAFYDSEWATANQFRNVDELSVYGFCTWSVLKDKTICFEEAIPVMGDEELDTYLRWYMIPGISLTKRTRKGDVLTMGYCELNQRDSYWTSWLHLVLFKDTEQQMIEESIHYQQPSGKIPTTILPLIERNDDLDINAFFILRATRFYQYYHNRDGLDAWWPALRKAMDWLIGRDDTNSGLPAQISFWGDWKDVKGVEGRKYSPFSCLIYLAALRQMIYLSKECEDSESLRKYETAYRKGYDSVNKPTGKGGLWNGEYYCQIWRDGTVNDKLLQDQTIGILFDVVPEDRAEKIIEALNKKSLTKYGICETSPYYPASFGYAPATYHNGAVWPWVSFMDCWSRIRMGRSAEAIDLIKRVAHADLVDSGDWSPNEHINSLTGENLGFQLQGWNAGLFGLVWFGLVHPGILPDNSKKVGVNGTYKRDK